MATLLDAGILEHFGSVFLFLLLFVVFFGVLESTNPFGAAKKGLHAIMALAVSVLFIMSVSATGVVRVLVPWFVILMVFVFFVLLVFRMFGMSNFEKIIQNTAVFPWVLIFAFIVLIGALSTVFGQGLLEAGGGGAGSPVVGPDIQPGSSAVPSYESGTTSTTTNNFSTNLLNILRHPKILGMVFIFLTGAFLMLFLTKPVNP